MPTKKYVIQWEIRDNQPRAVHQAAMARAKALESAHLSALKVMEKSVSGMGKGGGGIAAQIGQVDRLTKATKAGADASIAQARRASAERGRIYTQEEAQAKAAEREARARNKRMVDDAVLAERARARAVTAAGVGGMHGVSKPVRTAVDDYSGVQFRSINNMMRGVYKPGFDERDRVNAQARLIDAAIAAGSLSKSTVLHRGASLRSYGLTELPKPGDVIKDKAFGSTSTRREIAEGFSKGVMWEIHARKGIKGADVSHLTGGGEAEVLLARNQAMKVRSTHVDDQGRNVIVAEAMRSAQEQRDRDAMATTLRLRRAAEATESQRVRAAQAEMKRSSGGRGRPGTGVAAGAEGEPKIDVGYYKVVADQIKAAQKKEAEIDAIESKYIAKDYQRRVAAEAKKEKIDDFARSRTAKAISDRETLESSYLARDYQSRVKYEARKERLIDGPAAKAATYRRRDLTEAEAHAVALNRITDVRNKRHIEGIAKVMGEQRLSFAEAIHSAIGLDSALGKVGIAMAAIGAGKMLFGAVVGSMNDARDASKAMARQVLDTSAALREIAAIKGKFAPDAAEVEHHLAVRKASGLTHAEAVTYEAELQNVLGTVSKEKFTDVERDKLAISGAQLAARTGRGETDVKSRARMAGLVADFVKPRAGGKVMAADVTAMADAIDVINSMGAASQAVSTEQSAKLMTALTSEKMAGSFHDPRQAVALSTIASKFEPESSAEAAMQAIRQARGFTKFRQTKGTDASQAATLAAAGINEGMDPAQSMEALFGFAKGQMKSGEAFDAFMGRRGFRDQTGNMRLKQFYEEWEKGNFGRVMAEAAKPIEAGAPGRKFAAFKTSDVGRDLMSQAAIDAAKAKQGELVKEHLLRTQEAEAPYIEAGRETSTLGGMAEWAVGMGMGMQDKAKGREALLSSEAVRAARRDAGLEPGRGLGPIGTGAFGAYGAMFGPTVGQAAGSIAGYMSGENAEIVRNLKLIADSNAEMLRREKIKEGKAAAVPAQPQPVIRLDGPRNDATR